MTRVLAPLRKTGAQLDAWVDKHSTPEERTACNRYKQLQEDAQESGGMMGETALLEASQAIGILVKRNKRLGLANRGRA